MNIVINGTTYVVVATKDFTYNGDNRTAISVRLPRGKKIGEAVRYGNGIISDVVFA